jgi:quinol monooxygenase YgiN
MGRRVSSPQSGLAPIRGGDMTTVHIENTVQDFDAWKAIFDKYEQFRAGQGVQSYRVSRSVTEPNEVLIDLEFCDETAAQAFLPQLEKIMSSPQAQTQLVRHSVPRLYAVVTERVPSAAG